MEIFSPLLFNPCGKQIKIPQKLKKMFLGFHLAAHF